MAVEDAVFMTTTVFAPLSIAAPCWANVRAGGICSGWKYAHPASFGGKTFFLTPRANPAAQG